MIGAPIVVGVDGSSAATDAARWAAMWAQRAGRPLRLLSASTSRERRGLTSLFVRETAAVLGRHPDLNVDCVHECADASAALIEASRSAEAVVVGSRGAGGWEASRIGGVARDVSAYARCVVAIVPPGGSFPARGPVVVGVDGSPESEEAAEFAARQACTWRRDLLVVTAYPADGHLASSAASGQSVATGTSTQTVRTAVATGTAVTPGATGATGTPADEREAAAVAHRGAQVAAEALAAEPGSWSGRIEARALPGRPALVLADLAAGCSLVVVGARGAGGFAGKLIGATSRAVLEVTNGPVAVVRA